MIRSSLFFILTACSVFTSFAQEALKERPSPLAITIARYKSTYVKITYSQPHKRGREIFGKLVPFGQVWRLGANETTEITTTKDIIINSTLLKAGTYSMFTIPEKDSWTIIINADVGLWGSYNYNTKQDVFRFTVPAQKIDREIYEPLTIKLDQRNEVADLLILWDQTKISIPVKFIN
jgi:hypothetical protein